MTNPTNEKKTNTIDLLKDFYKKIFRYLLYYIKYIVIFLKKVFDYDYLLKVNNSNNINNNKIAIPNDFENLTTDNLNLVNDLTKKKKIKYYQTLTFPHPFFFKFKRERFKKSLKRKIFNFKKNLTINYFNNSKPRLRRKKSFTYNNRMKFKTSPYYFNYIISNNYNDLRISKKISKPRFIKKNNNLSGTDDEVKNELFEKYFKISKIDYFKGFKTLDRLVHLNLIYNQYQYNLNKNKFNFERIKPTLKYNLIQKRVLKNVLDFFFDFNMLFLNLKYKAGIELRKKLKPYPYFKKKLYTKVKTKLSNFKKIRKYDLIFDRQLFNNNNTFNKYFLKDNDWFTNSFYYQKKKSSPFYFFNHLRLINDYFYSQNNPTKVKYDKFFNHLKNPNFDYFNLMVKNFNYYNKFNKLDLVLYYNLYMKNLPTRKQYTKFWWRMHRRTARYIFPETTIKKQIGYPTHLDFSNYYHYNLFQNVKNDYYYRIKRIYLNYRFTKNKIYFFESFSKKKKKYFSKKKKVIEAKKFAIYLNKLYNFRDYKKFNLVNPFYIINNSNLNFIKNDSLIIKKINYFIFKLNSKNKINKKIKKIRTYDYNFYRKKIFNKLVLKSINKNNYINRTKIELLKSYHFYDWLVPEIRNRFKFKKLSEKFVYLKFNYFKEILNEIKIEPNLKFNFQNFKKIKQISFKNYPDPLLKKISDLKNKRIKGIEQLEQLEQIEQEKKKRKETQYLMNIFVNFTLLNDFKNKNYFKIFSQNIFFYFYFMNCFYLFYKIIKISFNFNNEKKLDQIFLSVYNFYSYLLISLFIVFFFYYFFFNLENFFLITNYVFLSISFVEKFYYNKSKKKYKLKYEQEQNTPIYNKFGLNNELLIFKLIKNLSNRNYVTKNSSNDNFLFNNKNQNIFENMSNLEFLKLDSNNYESQQPKSTDFEYYNQKNKSDRFPFLKSDKTRLIIFILSFSWLNFYVLNFVIFLSLFIFKIKLQKLTNSKYKFFCLFSILMIEFLIINFFYLYYSQFSIFGLELSYFYIPILALVIVLLFFINKIK